MTRSLSQCRQPAAKLGSLTIYKSFRQRTIAELEARGHTLRQVDGPIGHPIALRIDSKTGTISAAGDPRAHRHVLAY